MVSLKDIAKACQVSVATVSKALNDHNDISAETKERIRQVAKDMGYFPNSAAKALKTNRTYNIGVLFVDEARSGLTHNYFSHVLDSFKELLEYIYSRGHRKIAYIHGADSAVTQSRLSTFYRMAEQKGLSIPDAYIKEAAYRNADEAYERTRELLALEDRPTCILYQDDFASFGGIKAIRQAGLKIPQDISVAGYDGIRIAYQLEPQLTTLKQDTDSIGRLAAEQLISLIEEPKTTLICPYIVEGYVEKGQSVRDINHT